MKRLVPYVLPLLLGACGALGIYSPRHGVDQGYIYQYASDPLPNGDTQLTVWAPFGLGEQRLNDELRVYGEQVGKQQACSFWSLANQNGGVYNGWWYGRRYARADLRCTKLKPAAPEPAYQPPPAYSAPAYVAPLAKPAPLKAVKKKAPAKKRVTKKKKAPACTCATTPPKK